MREAKTTIDVTLVDPTYAYASCGGGGEMTNGGGCGNTVKFDPESMPFAKCPGCGVCWTLSDDNRTADRFQV